MFRNISLLDGTSVMPAGFEDRLQMSPPTRVLPPAALDLLDGASVRVSRAIEFDEAGERSVEFRVSDEFGAVTHQLFHVPEEEFELLEEGEGMAVVLEAGVTLNAGRSRERHVLSGSRGRRQHA